MSKKARKKWLSLGILAAGGGIVFQLPYLRYAFYTQLQQALGFSHEQYGNLMTVYAIVAMISYFPGGWLADRVSARKMITFSFISTGISGFYFATFPSYKMNLLLHGFWGISTILTYWAALLKVIRTLGTGDEQGRMYGMLEGGRGLASAIAAYALLAVYTRIGEGIYGMRWVIIVYSILHIVFGILTWISIKDPKESEKTTPVLEDIITVVKMPRVWLLCGVVFTTYTIFAGITYTPPYLQNIFGASVGIATAIGIFQRYIMQFLGGAGGGIIADKIGSRIKVLSTGYVVMSISLIIFIITPGDSNFILLIVANIVLIGVTVYVMRGLYFAIVNELEIPLRITGAAVGFASFIGYIPDIYIYKLIGRWLDKYPGVRGYKYMFSFMLIMTLAGMVIMFFVRKTIQKLEAKKRKLEFKKNVEIINN